MIQLQAPDRVRTLQQHETINERTGVHQRDCNIAMSNDSFVCVVKIVLNI